MIELFNIIKIDIKQIVYPIVYILIGVIIYYILKNIITKVTTPKIQLRKEQSQKTKTIRIVILNVIKYIIVILVTLAILSVFGINVKSIVAGLGITTAIIGLAFQDLAKDIIAGISIITENQYEIGDIIEVDGFRGEVVFLGLKTTRIRNFKGATKIIANHKMDNIINYSLHSSLAVLDISTSYETDIDKVEKTLNKLSDELENKIPKSKGKLQILGINELAESSVIYRVTLETLPMAQFEVERILRKEIKKAFDKANIKIPYTQIEVYNGK